MFILGACTSTPTTSTPTSLSATPLSPECKFAAAQIKSALDVIRWEGYSPENRMDLGRAKNAAKKHNCNIQLN